MYTVVIYSRYTIVYLYGIGIDRRGSSYDLEP